MTRLLCAISDHGLGHLAQTAPILNALHASRPDLEWLIWSGLTRATLESRIHAPFIHRHHAADIGMRMHDALGVDVPQSLRAYQVLHADWKNTITREGGWLKQEGISGVLSNVAYVPLAAAANQGISSVAFCSLNWLDIARHYLPNSAQTQDILAQIHTSYTSANAFLRLTPALPMAWLNTCEDIAPVASVKSPQQEVFKARHGLGTNTKIILMGFGGVTYAPSLNLPQQEERVWVVPDYWRDSKREDLITYDQTGCTFLDLLASCDVLITKVGYGSFVEAAALGLRVLYLDRPDWPETPWLGHWLKTHAQAESLDSSTLHTRDLLQKVNALLEQPAKAAISTPGATEASARILTLLGL